MEAEAEKVDSWTGNRRRKIIFNEQKQQPPPSFFAMLHEVLLALQGYPGDLINFGSKNYSETTLELDEDSELQWPDWLHPGEKHLLALVYRISQTYCYLESVANQTAVLYPEHESIYLHAFGWFLKDYLDEYQDHLLEVEERITAKDVDISPVDLVTQLEPFPTVMNFLCKWIRTQDILNRKGAKFWLDGVRECLIRTGCPEMLQFFQKLWKVMVSVFGQQVFRFVTGSDYFDPYEEFFVTEKLCFQKDLVPECLAPGMDSDIFFLSRAIKTIKSSKKLGGVMVDNIKELEESIAKLRNEDSSDFYSLSIALKSYRQSTSLVLWNLVVRECKLLEHLDRMKQYYLLGNYHFADEFINELDTLDDKRLVRAYRRACLNTDDDTGLDRFELCMKETDDLLNDFRKILAGVPVKLVYIFQQDESALEWIFQSKDIKEYNTIWIAMISLRSARNKLQSMWKKAGKRQPSTEESFLRHRLLTFLESWHSYVQLDVIAPLYDNLVDIINSVVDGRLNDKMSLLDSDIQEAHRILFLEPILKKCFLNQPPIVKCIFDIFSICRRFFQNPADYVAMSKEFEKSITFLFRCLTAISQMKSSTNVADLGSVDALEKDMDQLMKLPTDVTAINKSDTTTDKLIGDLNWTNQTSSISSVDNLLVKLDFNRFYLAHAE